MPKITIFIILISLLIISPIATNALSPQSITPESISQGEIIKGVSSPSAVTGVSDIVLILANIVKWIYIIFFIIAVMFILFAAYAYLTQGDSAEKISAVHSRIKYAAIAIIVALMATGFELIVKRFIIFGE